MRWCCWYFPGLSVVSETTMWHSRQVSETTFPHITLFTDGDDSAKLVPSRCCFWGTCFCSFSTIATSSFFKIYRGSNYFVASGCWPNYVSHCLVHRVSLTVPKNLDFCSTFPKASVTSRLYPHTLFLGSECWILPRLIEPMWNQVPKWKSWC